MFWGLILEPNKRYTQTVEKSFHVSMASLNLQKADDSVVQVMLYYEGTSYLLCNLRKSSTWQVPLDLNFHEGTTIAFICHGHGHVHLTGYLIPDEDLDLDELDEVEGEEEEEEEEEEEQVPQLVDKQSKRKAIDILKNEKNTKRLKQEIEAESSDEDIELDGMNEENDSDDSEEGDEESLLNEYEDEDEDEEGEEEDKEDEEEEEKEKVKPQQKDKRNKQQQKKKILNGKEAKHKKDKREQQQNEINTQSDQKTRVVEGGVQVKELKVGNGAFAKSGKLVSVYYVGRLKNGKKFDATTQGDGFKFRLGKGEVIKGWDVGIQGMKVGGKRQITIPPAMAYGAKGSPPVIPGNSTLMFEVELRNVH